MNQIEGNGEAAATGARLTAEQLLPLVYDELRRLAAAKMANQPPGQTLQPTALVHEAYLKLAGNKAGSWGDQRHFFSAAAKAMQQILVDTARRKARIKHAGGKQLVPVDDLDIADAAEDEKILLVNEALEKLALEDPTRAEVVRLRYFVGLTHAQTAEVLGLAEKTVRRHWEFSRVWLFEAIRALR